MTDLARNRKAWHDFEILEKLEAGVSLQGTEVKSCRQGNVNLGDGYVHIQRGEAYLVNVHISPYTEGNRENHEPMRERKLLLHKREIAKLKAATEQKGLTTVALRMYLKNGVVKVEIGLAKGKKKVDKRRDMRTKETDRGLRQALRKRT